MGKFLYRLEKKYSKHAIQNLTLILIGCMVAGYILNRVNPKIVYWLSLNPYDILHGQIWRLVTWVLVPPGELFNDYFLFTIIMLLFYYSIGRSLENAWGDFRYNVYIFSGFIFTVVGAFVVYGLAWLGYRDVIASGEVPASIIFSTREMLEFGGNGAYYFGNLPSYWFSEISTYYICLTVFLAYAFSFPNSVIYIFMIIPIRVIVLGVVDFAFLALNIVMYLMNGQWGLSLIILASILNFIMFFLSTRNYNTVKAQKFSKTRTHFKRDIQWAKANMGHEAVHEGHQVITRHKCAVCGRTELDGDMDFRFCSRCDGNYEYCADHINSHEHVRRI